MLSHFERGMRAAQKQDVGLATEHFRRAVDAEPDSAAALAWLGQTLAAEGQIRDGRQYLLRAGLILRSQPGGASRQNLCKIVTQLQKWGGHEEALEALGWPNVDDDGTVLRMRAASLSLLGRRSEAIEAVRLAQLSNPDDTMLEVFLSSLEIDAGERDLASERLSRLVGSDIGPREAFRARKELARIRDHQGRFGEAFSLLLDTQRLVSLIPEYANQSRLLLPAMIQENIETFGKLQCRRACEMDFDDRSPLFIMGFFRSGTTLLHAAFAAHPDVQVLDEAPLISGLRQIISRMPPLGASIASKIECLSKNDIAKLREIYWKGVYGRLGAVPEGTVIVDKFTMNTIDAGLISLVFPHAKIIFIDRDPRDVCLSCFQQIMPSSPATVHLLHWQNIAGFYGIVANSWKWQRKLIANEVFALDYEAFVLNFQQIITAALQFAGLRWHDAVSQFHLRASAGYISTPSRAQVSRPIFTDSIGKWRNYERPIDDILATLKPFIGSEDQPHHSRNGLSV